MGPGGETQEEDLKLPKLLLQKIQPSTSIREFNKRLFKKSH